MLCASGVSTITCKCSRHLESSGYGPPIASDGGANVEARRRGRAVHPETRCGRTSGQLFSLIVSPDTSPLFTLVLAGRTRRPVCDQRCQCASRMPSISRRRGFTGAPGSEQIVEWINANLALVQIVPTTLASTNSAGLKRAAQFAGSASRRRSRHLKDFFAATREPRPCCFFEDSDIEKRHAVVDQRVGLISTGDFLRELEAGGPYSIDRLHPRSGGCPGP